MKEPCDAISALASLHSAIVMDMDDLRLVTGNCLVPASLISSASRRSIAIDTTLNFPPSVCALGMNDTGDAKHVAFILLEMSLFSVISS